MTLLEELKIFLRNILYWIYSFVGFSVFFFVFGIKKAIIFGNEYILPLPTENSFSVIIFNKIRSDILPPDVQLMVTNPMSAFVSQITFSMLIGFLITIPLFLYRVVIYLQPALLPHERKALIWSLLPSTALFLSGAAFSYFFLIPATFKVLYPFATTLGAATFFSLEEFTSYVFGLMLSVGIMFLMPLFMILLSYMGIIKGESWIKIWRHALLFFLVLSAIITPDGTGVTMAILFLPLMTLYFLGCFFAEKSSKHQDL